jgi:hypothetical protein
MGRFRMQIMEQLGHRMPDAGVVGHTLEYPLLHRLRQIRPKLDHRSTEDLFAIEHREPYRPGFMKRFSSQV